MPDIGVLLFRLALPIVLIWSVSSVATALAFERVANANRMEEERVGIEAWLLYSATGAAAGGLFGTLFVLRDLATATRGGGDIARLLIFATPGMVLGAAFTCTVVTAVFHLRR
jgi:hypothetical protein